MSEVGRERVYQMAEYRSTVARSRMEWLVTVALATALVLDWGWG